MVSANMAFAATRTISDAGGNWDNVNTWDEGVVPIAGDDVVAQGDGTSGNVTINVTSACASIILTNYTGTLTQSANMTTTSTITFVAGMTFTYSSGTWLHIGTATITSAGKVFEDLYFFGVGAVITLADDLDVDTRLRVGKNTTINGNTVKAGGDVIIYQALSGTTTFLFDGTGSWSSTAAIQTSTININTAGTLTLTDVACVGTTTLTYISGTIAGSGTLNLVTGTTPTLDTSGCIWPSATITSLGPITLTSDLNVVNLISNNASNSTINGNNINMSGNFTQAFGNLIGTTTLNINGSTDQNINGHATYGLGINTVINSSGGTVYIGSSLRFYGAKTLTYTAGTVDCTTNSNTLQLLNSCTLNTTGVNWYNVNFIGTGTYTFTLSSAMSVDGTLSVNTGVVATLATSDITASGSLTVTGTGIITGRTITLDGTGTWSHTSTGEIRSNLTINTAGTITVSGVVYYNTGTLLYTAGTVTTTGSTLTLTNTCTLSSGAIAWNNVSTTTAGTVTLGTALDVNGTLNIGASTTLAAAGFDITVGGDWTKTGTFTHGNNEVIFDTVANTSVISGTNTFYDLTCNTASKAIQVAASTTQTIANTLTLNGQAQGTRITLDINGGTPGTDRFTFDVTGGAQVATFVDVADSNASTNDIVATGSANSGNTDSLEASPHWVISGGGSQIIMVNQS